jgi:DNA-binding MarR family transcriptional regulator
MGDLRMSAWRAFLEAHARVTALLEEDLQRGRRLSLAWYDVLVQLEEAEGHRLRMTELARRVVISKSGLTRLVDRMVEAGLVTRCFDDVDRRGRWVAITDEGLERLRDAAPRHLRGVRQYFLNELDAESARVLAEVLGRIGEKAAAELAERVSHRGR